MESVRQSSEDEGFGASSSEGSLGAGNAPSLGDLKDPTEGEYSNHYHTTNMVIAQGAYGTVVLSTRRSDRRRTVTKFIVKRAVQHETWMISARRGGRTVPTEIELLQTINHPNVVQAENVFENSVYYQIVFPFHSGTIDLFTFIDHRARLDDALYAHIFREVCAGIAHVHSLGLLHRDIKDENVLIRPDWSCQVCDLGACVPQTDDMILSYCGTYDYAAPEVIIDKCYHGFPSEMWSLGVMLFALLYKDVPFHKVSNITRMPVMLRDGISKGATRLLIGLLKKNPKERMTMEQLWADPWMQQAVDLSGYDFKQLVKDEKQPFDVRKLSQKRTMSF